MPCGFRLVQDFLDAHGSHARRHGPVHRLTRAGPQQSGPDRRKDRQLLLLDTGIGRKYQRIDIFRAGLDVFDPDLGIHRDHIMRNGGWVDDMGAIELVLQALQMIPVSRPDAGTCPQDISQIGSKSNSVI
jgi:hypothetical protein